MIDRGRHSVLGVLVDAVDYEAATERILEAARSGHPAAVTALAVHGVMTGAQDPEHEARLNSFDLVVPDGQPVRWALNLLHRVGLRDRVYGPELTAHVLRRCAEEGLPVYFYGSTPETLERLLAAVASRYPDLQVAGHEPSGFRTARPGETSDIGRRITESGARVVFVGLGCPRQELFVHALREHVAAPLLAVGAAFDYHAGQLRNPPSWMQRAGFEWLWRLGLEPRRLWRRYLLLNPAYVVRLLGQWTRIRKTRPVAATRVPIADLPV
jgi:exopolysaccharide biosynthesis WecB/TagA/CpsF family protein